MSRDAPMSAFERVVAGILAGIATFWGAIVTVVLSPEKFPEWVIILPIVTLPCFLLSLKWFDISLWLLTAVCIARWICYGWASKMIFFSPVQTYGDAALYLCVLFMGFAKWRQMRKPPAFDN